MQLNTINNMKTLRVMMVPTYDSTRESMGIEDFEDGGNDAILFQQGYDSESFDIEDEEDFTINEGYTGQAVIVETDEDGNEEEIEECFLIYELENLKDKHDFLLEADLEEGTYTFLAEHNAILWMND